MNFVRRIATPVALILVLSGAVSGCGVTANRGTIADFSQAVGLSATALKKYYQSVNALYRQQYMDDLRFHPDQTVGTVGQVDSLPYNTGLVCFYDPADVQVRVNALSLLGDYAAGLQALASNDAPDRVEKTLKEIGGKMDSIDRHVQVLLKSKSALPIGNYGKPLTAITGVALKYWLEQKREHALIDCIKANKDDVNKLFGYLEDDVKTLNTTYSIKIKDALLWRVEHYNNAKSLCRPSTDDGKPTATDDELRAMVNEEKRLKYLQELSNAAANVTAIDEANPSSLITAMHESHVKLVECAESNACSKSKAYLELLGNLHLFVTQAKQVALATDKLEQIANAKLNH